MTEKILIIDDETSLQEAIAGDLRQKGYQVLTPRGDRAVRSWGLAYQPDLVIMAKLDLLIPGACDPNIFSHHLDSLTEQAPILILTTRAAASDRLIRLELDPGHAARSPLQLMAYIHVQLHHNHQALQLPPELTEEEADLVSPSAIITAGPIRVDVAGRKVWCRGKPVELQYKQFELLLYLVQNRGVVLSRDQLLQHVWGYDYNGDIRTVDVHIRWLREKLEENPAAPTLIQTIRGVGYCFRA